LASWSSRRLRAAPARPDGPTPLRDWASRTRGTSFRVRLPCPSRNLEGENSFEDALLGGESVKAHSDGAGHAASPDPPHVSPQSRQLAREGLLRQRGKLFIDL